MANVEAEKKKEVGLTKQIVKKNIPIAEIWSYVDKPVCLGEDIVLPSGAILVPSGADISALKKYAKSIDKILSQRGLKTVRIELHNQLNLEGIEHFIKTSENFVNIDNTLIRETTKQMEDVYNKINTRTCKPEDVEKLITSGKYLNKIASKAPEIMFCLGNVKASDEYTYIHSLNVGLLGSFIANKMFPNDQEFTECISVSGILHDIGKGNIPKEILNKPGKLTVEEFETMKQHTVFGVEIAERMNVNDKRILSTIRSHHEKFGGGGYPDGLEKQNISMEARIISVADVFDAMTAKRVYKEPMELCSAMSSMLDDTSMLFDPAVLRTLLVSMGMYPPGTIVELSDGSIGTVIGSNGNNLIRPQVILNSNSNGQQIEQIRIIDLSEVNHLRITKTIQSFKKLGF